MAMMKKLLYPVDFNRVMFPLGVHRRWHSHTFWAVWHCCRGIFANSSDPVWSLRGELLKPILCLRWFVLWTRLRMMSPRTLPLSLFRERRYQGSWWVFKPLIFGILPITHTGETGRGRHVRIKDCYQAGDILIYGAEAPVDSDYLNLSRCLEFFSVLDNRHLADICAICQKCQFSEMRQCQS